MKKEEAKINNNLAIIYNLLSPGFMFFISVYCAQAQCNTKFSLTLLILLLVEILFTKLSWSHHVHEAFR